MVLESGSVSNGSGRLDLVGSSVSLTTGSIIVTGRFSFGYHNVPCSSTAVRRGFVSCVGSLGLGGARRWSSKWSGRAAWMLGLFLPSVV